MAAPKINAEAVAESLKNFIAEHHPQHLIISESAHDIAGVTILQQPAVMDVLQDRTMNLEARREFQQQADQVAAGTMTPQGLAEYAVAQYDAIGDKYAQSAAPLYVARGELIQAAEKKGIKVNFVEGQSDLQGYVAILDKVAEVNAVMKNAVEHADTELTREEKSVLLASSLGKEALLREKTGREVDAIKAMPQDDRNKMGAFFEERLSNDGNLAAAIKEQSGGKSTVTLYGLEHGGGVDDLDQKLGPSTERIVIVANEKTYITQSQKDYGLGREAPAAYLNYETGEMISGKEAYAAAEKVHANQKAPAGTEMSFLEAAKAAAVSGITLAEHNPVQPDGGFSQVIAGLKPAAIQKGGIV